jgi:adenosylcobyric acid synthase
MGKEIKDPDGVESERGSVPGLGLLDMITVFQPEKTTSQVKARILSNEGLLEGLGGEEITGYEIHMGQTTGGNARPLFRITRKTDKKTDYIDGVANESGLIFGSYLHGLFDNANFRDAFLAKLSARKGLEATERQATTDLEQQFDRLADVVRQSLNMELVYQIGGLKR